MQSQVLTAVHLQVWFFDGNVKCWERGHIPLGIVAVVSLVAQALLVLFVAAVTYHKTLRKKVSKLSLILTPEVRSPLCCGNFKFLGVCFIVHSFNQDSQI